MHQIIIVVVYSPLAIVGMMLVITWGMNAAGVRRDGHGQDVGSQVELCDICPMKPFVMYGTDGEFAACTSGSVSEKPGTLQKLKVERSFGYMSGIVPRPIDESGKPSY